MNPKSALRKKQIRNGQNETAISILLGVLLLLGATLLFVFSPRAAGPSCTIFTVARGDSVFYGSNEDNNDERQGRIWFFQPGEGRNGVALFGYRMGGNLDIPVAGMNDQGLIADSNTVGFTRASIHPQRETLPGSFFIKMLEECSTVEEVREWARSYDLLFLETQQVHVADRQGNAIVLGLGEDGELQITEMAGDYLVSTNFNLAQETPEEANCSRYEEASTMLAGLDDPTVQDCTEILDATALRIVMYSYVADLKNGTIHLFSRGDFEQSAPLLVADELDQGDHSYDIQSLIDQGWGWRNRSIILGCVIPALVVAAGSGCYFLLRRNGIRSAGKAVVILAGLVILLGILRNVLRLPIPLVIYPNLVTVTLHLSFATALVYSIGILFRPGTAATICALGLALGEVVYCLVSGCGDLFPLHLVLALSSYGMGTVVISALRKRNELMAMMAGSIWMFIGFSVPAWYYYTFIAHWKQYVLLYAAIVSTANLLFIPLAGLLIKGVRLVTKTKYLDDSLFRK